MVRGDNRADEELSGMPQVKVQGEVVQRAVAIGVVAVFGVVLAVSLAFGAPVWIGLLLGLLLGVFVGGGLGLLIGGRVGSTTTR